MQLLCILLLSLIFKIGHCKLPSIWYDLNGLSFMFILTRKFVTSLPYDRETGDAYIRSPLIFRNSHPTPSPQLDFPRLRLFITDSLVVEHSDSNTVTALTWNKICFVLSERSDFR